LQYRFQLVGEAIWESRLKEFGFMMHVYGHKLAALVLAAGLFATAASTADEPNVSMFYVQNAESVAFEGDTLTLRNVGRTTSFFSDRPDLIVGHELTDELVAFWGDGEDNFVDSPPNATLSILGGDEVVNIVMVLTNPRLEGANLLYDIKILNGTPPQAGGPSSLFIDSSFVHTRHIGIIHLQHYRHR
jgi:hypothetical protein